jgi:hypothetical protein
MHNLSCRIPFEWLKERYGLEKEAAEKDLDNWLDRLH